MEFITKILNMDFGALVPDVDKIISAVQVVLTIAVLAGPIALMVLGVLHFFFSPPEANYKFGYRTYFGMGSVEAWQLTQKIAGVANAAVGLILVVCMLLVAAGFRGKDAFSMGESALIALIWQAAAVLVMRAAVFIIMAVLFQTDGSRRRPKLTEEAWEETDQIEDADFTEETEEFAEEQTEEEETVIAGQ